MKKPAALLTVGLLCVLLSLSWSKLLPTDWLWDDARAVELTDLSEELHGAMHKHDRDHDDDHFGETHSDDPPKVIALAKDYRAAQAELESAKFWMNSMPSYLRWTGLLVCAVGIVWHVAASDKSMR